MATRKSVMSVLGNILHFSVVIMKNNTHLIYSVFFNCFSVPGQATTIYLTMATRKNIISALRNILRFMGRTLQNNRNLFS